MWSKENSDGHKVGLPEHQEMEKAQADRCHLPPGDIQGERASGYIPLMVPVEPHRQWTRTKGTVFVLLVE